MKKYTVRETIVIQMEVEAVSKKQAVDVARDNGIAHYGDQIKDIFTVKEVK